MLWVLRRSLSRQQSKPSMRIEAGLNPNLVRAHPFLLWGDIVEPSINNGSGLSSANRASWTTGLADRVGGEPAKNGGDIEISPPLHKKGQQISKVFFTSCSPTINISHKHTKDH